MIKPHYKNKRVPSERKSYCGMKSVKRRRQGERQNGLYRGSVKSWRSWCAVSKEFFSFFVVTEEELTPELAVNQFMKKTGECEYNLLMTLIDSENGYEKMERKRRTERVENVWQRGESVAWSKEHR